VQQCSRWPAILQEAYGSSLPEIYPQMRAFNRWVRDRFLAVKLIPGAWRILRARFAEYADNIERLYRAIIRSTGSTLIVDSSKSVMYAQMLLSLGGLEVHLVHLVRDPRGVEYSLQKRKRRGIRRFRRHHPITGALQWDIANLFADRLSASSGSPAMRLRYEDLVSDPIDSLERIASLTGESVAIPGAMSRQEIELMPNHSVAGNARRFRTGAITLRLDSEWRNNMDPGARRWVSWLSRPLLRRYGYPGAMQTDEGRLTRPATR
jgi:hypothetical protein